MSTTTLGATPLRDIHPIGRFAEVAKNLAGDLGLRHADRIDLWDEKYRSVHRLLSGEPNALLGGTG
ncbi:hypothetical protein [Actinoplanes sp. NPDC049265]|uniref:hypothetical protein n=1 Tax=Actinoplanes sp. NPDC049265 TaxID=3363902 RepID=UPI003711FB76